MSTTTISADVQELARNAGSHYGELTRGAFEDARLGGLRYLMLRLSALEPLSDQDKEQLGELARLAFQELDVTAAANQIKTSASAGPLIVAIAEIVQAAQDSKRMALLGAVLGARAGLAAMSASRDARILQGVLGAIAGAAAASMSKFIQDDIERALWLKFTEAPLTS